ncbi:class I SAM-dependent methyltransferase [Pseudomonas sp. GV071]|uniref:class I SAM-dependent methyltransferase n=1 Tax=Pseudomonas sp. GV071 TaxID=2135754 RepID=UPI000D38DC4B|nr:class I SAM-dependent methyltransferase [Pseudomonas sp. GV071]PTQ68238.1 23S rRNA (cytosine1962-C5)-methyltransferase [Pseudomonas sp. GV071]
MHSQALASLHQHLLSELAGELADARRLFHGRGLRWSGLEELTVDWLQGVVLVCLFRQPADDELAALQAMLLTLAQTPAWQRAQAHSVLLQHRYKEGDATSLSLNPAGPVTQRSRAEWIVGGPHPEWLISEDGLRFQLDLGQKQNTGLFLDMRYGRRWVREQADGKRVLNLFAYTCGFSVAALAGGASHVVNLDMAKGALNRGRDNHRLNQQDLSQVSFLGHELFKSWSAVKRYAPYDLIIIDPPTFQKGSFALTQDYGKILRRLPDLLNADGVVLACVNDPHIGPDFLIANMAEHAPGLHFEQRLANPPEFADVHEHGGLKALVFRQAPGALNAVTGEEQKA